MDTIVRYINSSHRYIITFTDLYSRYGFAWSTTSHASKAAERFFMLVQVTVGFQLIVNKPSQKAESPLILTATELFDNLAKLIPPPHRHRHHYHGVLAPNSKQRAKVTQFANRYYRLDTAENRALQDDLKIEAAASKLIVKPPAKTGSKTWARLIAKVYEVDPLKCEGCGAAMKLMAFINDTISINQLILKPQLKTENEPLV